MKSIHNKKDGEKNTELKCTDVGRGYSKLSGDFQRLHIFPKTPAPPNIPQLCSATHPPQEAPIVCFQEQRLQSFKGKLKTEWPHSEPRHLELALCQVGSFAERGLRIFFLPLPLWK